MQTLLKRLSKDHEQMLRLLNFLEYKIDLMGCSVNENESPIILEILDYLTQYPELLHHPVEDCLYSALLKKQSVSGDAVWNVQSEHRELVNLGNFVKGRFYDLVNGKDIAKEYVSYHMNLFIQRQKDHMQREEELLFPLAWRVLNQQDWEQLNEDVEEYLNPSSGPDFQSEFDNFYNRITDEMAHC